MRAARVFDDEVRKPRSLRRGGELSQLRRAAALERDLLLPLALPPPQHRPVVWSEGLVHRQRGVAALRGDLARGHAELFVHHQDELHLLVGVAGVRHGIRRLWPVVGELLDGQRRFGLLLHHLLHHDRGRPVRQAQPRRGEEADHEPRELELFRPFPVPSQARGEVAAAHAGDGEMLRIAVGARAKLLLGFLEHIVHVRSSEATHRPCVRGVRDR